MASLQRVKVKGHSYWRIVESRRVNGKPRLFVLAHLGKVDDFLLRLQSADALRLSSFSHGAVAAVFGLSRDLDIAGIIDHQLALSGRRDRHQKNDPPNPFWKPLLHEGLTVGRSMELICTGRACHPTSKMAYSEWAKTTTLGDLAQVNPDTLSSQHFWDQMDQIPVEALAAIEREIVARAIERFRIPLDTLLYDATNFFTFIATTNTRCEIPARGHNKQKRNDLRQVGVALVCNKGQGIPLFHQVYGGKLPDVRSFAEALPAIKERLQSLGQDIGSLTVVYDKGNMSRANQSAIDRLALHYVASLTVASQRALVEEANTRFEDVDLDEGKKISAFRTQRVLWGAERTAVVVVSERLRSGQLRGIHQHLASATTFLSNLSATLLRGKQRREKAAIQRDIERRLSGRQFLGEILRVHLDGEGQNLRLTYEVDQDALCALAQNRLGRLILVTSRHEWSTREIILAYRGQAKIEEVFEHLKDPYHVMLRPQHHWTDQKLHVHTFTCIIGYLLGRLLHLKAQREIGYAKNLESLLDDLEKIRKVKVVRSAGNKGLRVTTQFEEMDADRAALAKVFALTA